MKCPKCKTQTKVIDTRENAAGTQTRRRHKCKICVTRFSTFERRNDTMLEEQALATERAFSNIAQEISGARYKIIRARNTAKNMRLK